MNENERQHREMELREIDPEDELEGWHHGEKIFAITLFLAMILMLAWNFWEAYG